MGRAARENAVCALMACAGSATLAWLGLYGPAWNDYDTEVRPAYEALLAGHVSDFLRLAPAYGGSLIIRAPLAMAPALWGGGQLAVYRMAALPCLLAAAALGVWLTARIRADRAGLLARVVTLGVCVANPVTLRALEVGHPEELLGASLCVAAVLLAARGRGVWAGLALGLAIANKEWALLAAGPVLLALSPALRMRCALLAGGVCAAILAPLALVSSGGFAASTSATASTASGIFQPWQLWWFAGVHAGVVRGSGGAVKVGYRTGPEWAARLSHPLILFAGLMVAGALWAVSRRGSAAPAARVWARERDALLALSLALLLRCILDTWDTAYYALPFILALLAWEVAEGSGRPPVLALSASVLVWISFQWLALHASADVQAAFYLLWSLPLAAWMGMRLARSGRARARGPAGPQEMTVSSLERLVSIS